MQYNTKIQSFLTNIIASVHGFSRSEMLEISAAERENAGEVLGGGVGALMLLHAQIVMNKRKTWLLLSVFLLLLSAPGRRLGSSWPTTCGPVSSSPFR